MGRRIADAGIGISGTGRAGVTTGAKVALDDFTAFTAMQITLDEQAHVNYLRAALKDNAIAKPEINLEALGLGFRNQTEFLTVAAIFEDVGVSAYGGAAPLIASPVILGAAAQIALTEAQHAGVLRSSVSRANLEGDTVAAIVGVVVAPDDAAHRRSATRRVTASRRA